MLVQVSALGDEEEMLGVPARQPAQQPLQQQVRGAGLGEARRGEGVCGVVGDQEVKQSLEREERVGIQRRSWGKVGSKCHWAVEQGVQGSGAVTIPGGV